MRREVEKGSTDNNKDKERTKKMKTMVIVENDYERAQLRLCWDALMRAKANGKENPSDENFISAAMNMDVEGEIDLFHPKDGNLYAIVYDLLPDGWHIYNFNTMEEEIVPEGDLAGLCNSKEGNFPFFN